MIVREFACMCAKSEIDGLREFECLSFEAFGPFIFGFVLELEFE